MKTQTDIAHSILKSQALRPFFSRGRGLAGSQPWRLLAMLLAGFILYSVSYQRAMGQSYSVDWYKIAGGGGTSTGGTFQVSGTIGQPDASATMSGGQFSVVGGFWSLINVVQTPGAPLLKITYFGNQAVVSWSPSATGWTLQTNANLGTPAWGNYLGSVVNHSVTNSPPIGNLFFRLKQ